MDKRTALIKSLIRFHWNNIVKDIASIGVTEMTKRTAVISGLRARIAQPPDTPYDLPTLFNDVNKLSGSRNKKQNKSKV